LPTAPGYSGPPIILSFSPASDTINRAESTTLSWAVTNVTAVTIDNGIGHVFPLRGSVSVAPAATATYTLTATNPVGSATATTTVAVLTPDVEYWVIADTSRPLASIGFIDERGNSVVVDRPVLLLPFGTMVAWKYVFSGARAGQRLQVSAVNPATTDCVDARIYRRGELIATDNRCGWYKTATASATF